MSVHLRELVGQGRVGRIGRTRSTLFYAGEPAPSRESRRLFQRDGLEEHTVLEWARAAVLSGPGIRTNVRDILDYALSEMVNNAIEHSASSRILVSCRVDDYGCSFEVRDWGRGAFRTIAEKLGISDESEAILLLLKGRKTIDPLHHSGEGLFFTARSADEFDLSSHGSVLAYRHGGGEVSIRGTRRTKGTFVRFGISVSSRRRLSDVFEAFAPEDFEYRFERTVVHVAIHSRACISRSQARRMMTGTGEFREVMLDFRDVTSLGQAFCDEVFRVIPGGRAGLKVVAVNVPETLEPMIAHSLGTVDRPD